MNLIFAGLIIVYIGVALCFVGIKNEIGPPKDYHSLWVKDNSEVIAGTLGGFRVDGEQEDVEVLVIRKIKHNVSEK